jgi:starvation-inducible DNA-binding protein
LDFKLYTNALKAFESPSGDHYVTGTTSSTIKDRHGDSMTMNALKSMEETAKQNLTVFLNHNYEVPQDLFGSVQDARIVKRWDQETGQEVYDLDIDIRVVSEDENPLAMKTYRAIKRGVKLGLSIGARVAKVQKEKDAMGEDTYVIDEVSLLESSVVGIPANQRSYLQNALKSLRGGAERAEDDDFSDVYAEAKAAGGLKVGDMVSWGSSGGRARGKITRIVREGSVKVPDSSFTITAEENDPAVLIRVYDGDKPTDRIVGHKMSTLRATKSVGELVEKAVEIEGQPTADKSPLIGSLYTLLSETTAFYLKAHGAHWNVVGEEFASYHELFEEIYKDAHASLDPIAESLRKLNSPAPAELKDLASMASGRTEAESYEAEDLARDLYAANEKLIENIMVAFKAATDLNQQGVANFLAERQDMHQKWSWQLRSSIAEEADETESESEGNDMEKNMSDEELIEKKTRVTVTVSTDGTESTPAPAPAASAAPAAVEAEPEGEDDLDAIKASIEPDVKPDAEVEVAEEPASEEEAAPSTTADAVAALESLGAVLVRSGEAERKYIAQGLIDLARDIVPGDEAAVEVAAEEPAVAPEAPIVETDAPAVEAEVEVAPVAVEAQAEVVEEAKGEVSIAEIESIAKSALDSAIAAQQEVGELKERLTELQDAKIRVEQDMEKAIGLIGQILDHGVGRKSVTPFTVKTPEAAPWLSPYVRRTLETQE